MEESKCCSDFLLVSVIFYWIKCDVPFTGPIVAGSRWVGRDICSLVVVDQLVGLAGLPGVQDLVALPVCKWVGTVALDIVGDIQQVGYYSLDILEIVEGTDILGSTVVAVLDQQQLCSQQHLESLCLGEHHFLELPLLTHHLQPHNVFLGCVDIFHAEGQGLEQHQTLDSLDVVAVAVLVVVMEALEASAAGGGMGLGWSRQMQMQPSLLVNYQHLKVCLLHSAPLLLEWVY